MLMGEHGLLVRAAGAVLRQFGPAVGAEAG